MFEKEASENPRTGGWHVQALEEEADGFASECEMSLLKLLTSDVRLSINCGSITWARVETAQRRSGSEGEGQESCTRDECKLIKDDSVGMGMIL